MDGVWAGYRWVGREQHDVLMPGVHQAVRVADGLAVAIKIVASTEVPALRREASLAAVVHPHLVQVIELAEEGPTVGLVTAWAQGGSLADLLDRRGTLDVREVVAIMRWIASALAAAHGQDVVHGDVTPANILFDAAGRAILADLGAARGRTESGVPVQVTPTNVAPEVARGKQPDAAADLFGLGSVGLACLTGRPAWPAENLRDVLVQSTVGQWPDPGEAGGDTVLTAAIRSLLDPEPDRRPGAAALVVELAGASGSAEVDLLLPGRGGGIVGAPPDRQETVGRESDPTSGGHAAFGRSPAAARERPNQVGVIGGRRVATQLRDLGGADPEPRRRRWARFDGIPAGTANPAGRLAALGRRPGALARERPAPGPRHAAAQTGPQEPTGPDAPARGTKWRRVAIPLVAVVAVIFGAVQAGLWWAGWEVPVAGRSAGSSALTSGSAIAPGSGSGAASTAEGTAGSTSAGTRGTSEPAARTGPVRTGPARTGPARTGPVRTGPVRTGPARTRPVRTGPVRTESPGVNGEPQSPGAGALLIPPRPTSEAEPTAAPSVVAGRGNADWVDVVSGLDLDRARALVQLNPALLDRVYTGASAPRRSDLLKIAGLRHAGWSVSGAAHRVQEVSVLDSADPGDPQAGRIVLRVVDRLPSYQVLDASRQVIDSTPARPAAPRVMVLIRTAAGWRIDEVRDG